MNREEASFILANIDRRVCDDELNEALDVAIKALEQEPCDDEYIKVPKKALKYRTKGMVAYNAEWLKNYFDIERAVICGAQQPCEDTISRQAVLDIIDSDWKYEGMEHYVNNLPSVTPQPKTGHWSHDGSHWKNRFICSGCGYKLFDEPTNYCPNCGAKMQESEEV